MPTTSSYGKYLPPVLWSPPPPAAFGILSMLAPFEKVLTGIDDDIPITHGDGSVLTTVNQAVIGNPLPQTVRIVAGSGSNFIVGRSYTYDQGLPEVINIIAAAPNTITATFRQNHLGYQTITDNSGVHLDIQSVIAALVRMYGPWSAPSNYLDWLAQWVALQTQPSWDEYQKRTAVSIMAPLYAKRGTKQGLDEFFDLYAVSPRRPRLVVDNDSKLLFVKPKSGQTVQVSTLVAQKPLVAPQCAAMDASGYIFVGDLGSSDATIKPAIWRISPSGDYDYAAGADYAAVPPGVPESPQPFQPSTPSLQAPVAVATDSVNGGAYLIDNVAGNYVLYRLTTPHTGTIKLTGTPATAQSGTITIAGTKYVLAQTGTLTPTQQAAAWVTALNATASFSSKYTASSAGPVITITPLVGPPANDLLDVTSSTTGLTLAATGPAFGTATTFVTGPPPLGLHFPRGMCINSAGHPMILDRGAAPGTPSSTAIIDVQIGAGPTYSGRVPHAIGTVVEPLSMCLRANGSLVVADAASQTSTNPADLIAIDTGTWTATSLLGTVPAGLNPLVAPTGIVEIDAHHLLVVDAGLRPFIPSPTTPFTALIAQQAGVYLVDHSSAPPVISLAGELKSLVYPRTMVGDGRGTFYVCDSGLPDLPGYQSRKWRSSPQQCSVLAHFQGDPSLAVFRVTISGTPTTGNQCSISIGSTVFDLHELTGDTPAQQAAAWSIALNGDGSFGGRYAAVAVANVLSIYPIAGTAPNSGAFGATSSATVTLTVSTSLAAAPFSFGTVTLSGLPSTGESCRIVLGSTPFTLPETTGYSLAQQAAAWCTTLNATPSFSGNYLANNTGGTINVFARTVAAAATQLSALSSAHLALDAYSEIQNRRQFLQSVRDVVNDQIPAHARWYLQSELTQV